MVILIEVSRYLAYIGVVVLSYKVLQVGVGTVDKAIDWFIEMLRKVLEY